MSSWWYSPSYKTILHLLWVGLVGDVLLSALSAHLSFAQDVTTVCHHTLQVQPGQARYALLIEVAGREFAA